MKKISLILGAVFMLLALGCNASATCPNGATFTQGGWINWTPTIGGMTSVTIEVAQYQTDPYCNTTIVLAFKGTSNGGAYATFTTPFGATLPYQFIPALFLCSGGTCPTGTPGGNAFIYPYSNPTNQWGVTPYSVAVPAAGAVMEYRVTGTYR